VPVSQAVVSLSNQAQKYHDKQTLTNSRFPWQDCSQQVRSSCYSPLLNTPKSMSVVLGAVFGSSYSVGGQRETVRGLCAWHTKRGWETWVCLPWRIYD